MMSITIVVLAVMQMKRFSFSRVLLDGMRILLYEMALESWDWVRMDMTGKHLYINTPDISTYCLSLYTITTTNEYNSNWLYV